jgi:RNA polymerase sigma factor for flagellar operon FliA
VNEGNTSREHSLWEEYRHSRDTNVREKIVSYYEPLSKSIAARMYGLRVDDSVSFDDYLQYGRVGLLEAVERYDLNRDISFGSFSSARIRGAILNGIVRESELAAQHKFWKRRWQDRLDSIRTSVAPAAERASLAEIVSITMGLAVGVILEELREDNEPADLDPNNNPYAVNELQQLRAIIVELIERLPARERSVVHQHYFKQMEFQLIAEQLSVTKSRVSQVHGQAIIRLRTWLGEEKPRLDRKL